jgi:hypothetical protein
MKSLKDSFADLQHRIRQGRELSHASYEPIYYLVFDPRQILEVKRLLPAWSTKLTGAGWKVHTFSIYDAIGEILASAPMRQIWLEADRRAPCDWKKTNEALRNAVVGRNQLQTRLEAKLAELEGRDGALLLVTDLEALHPYVRIGAIEAELQGKFHVPTIFLYPGVRTGKTRLKFLGFYPEDGNYRSVHVGG